MNNKNSFIQGHSALFVRNAGFNLFTQIWLFVLFAVTTPIVVHKLGDEAYGIFSIVLVLTGYFSFLDLGISQATTKFVSEHLARRERHRAQLVVTASISTNIVLGILGGILIVFLAPIFAERIFKVAPVLQEEAKFAFYILAFGFPAILIQGTLQSIPASFQRFDIINLINGVAGTIQGLTAVGLVLLGFGLKAIVISYVIIRILSTLSYFFVLFKLMPDLQLRISWHQPAFQKLINFGKWLIISSLVGPLMVNFDRILIGTLLTVGAVTYYVVPYGMASKLGIISGSLWPVLFPAFSERNTLANRDSFKNLFLRSERLMYFALVPLVIIIIVFAEELLQVWMGGDFAQKSTFVAQVLALAILVNSLTTIPYTAIQGLGRPDLPAKFHLIELPIYIGLCFVLIPILGINGAAIAWTIRVTVDAILLLWAIRRIANISLQRVFTKRFVRGLLLGVVFGIILILIKFAPSNLIFKGVLVASSLGLYILTLWRYGIDEIERQTFLRMRFKALSSEVF